MLRARVTVLAKEEVGRNADTQRRLQRVCFFLAPLLLSINPRCTEAAARKTWPLVSLLLTGTVASKGGGGPLNGRTGQQSLRKNQKRAFSLTT